MEHSIERRVIRVLPRSAQDMSYKEKAAHYRQFDINRLWYELEVWASLDALFRNGMSPISTLFGSNLTRCRANYEPVPPKYKKQLKWSAD